MKKILLVIGLSIATGMAFTQSLNVHQKGGNITTIKLSDIDSITFSVIPVNGLIAYYPFNGDAKDESGNGNNGTLHGNAKTTDRNGIADAAFSFNGSTDFINIPHNAMFNSDSISISCWVYSDIAISGTKGIIYKDANSGDKIREFGLCAGDGKTGKSVLLETSDGSNIFSAIGQSAITLGQWYHIVGIIKDGSFIKVYLNGKLDSEKSINFSHKKNTNEIVIGKVCSYSDAARFWKGKIDDIRIYNRVLNDQEISLLFAE